MNIENKKVILVGLGILGGGVATAKWLCEKGAKLLITDLRDANYLIDSIEKLKEYNVTYTLGEHRESDVKDATLVVVNPDVPLDSPFINYVRSQNIPIENELTLFAHECASDMQIAVTGTRGKTTTVAWIEHVLKLRFPQACIAGNSPTNPFLKMIKSIQKNNPVVLEAPSFQLELENNVFKPKIAVITNIYRDHINRHKSEEGYAQVKMNIFANQDANDFLILNIDNDWTQKILQKDLTQKLWLISAFDILRTAKSASQLYHNAVYINNGSIMVRKEGVETIAMSAEKIPGYFGEHMLMNFMMALSVGIITGISTEKITGAIESLPTVKFRQEKIFDGKIDGWPCEVFNDTTATSPDATIAAIKRFGGKAIYIIGGTDKELEFDALAEIIKKELVPEQLIFLDGSATNLLSKSLAGYEKEKDYVDKDDNSKNKKIKKFDTLEECVRCAIDLFKREKVYKSIVFSPAAKSFEKFKNEYDRGVQFNEILLDLLCEYTNTIT